MSDLQVLRTPVLGFSQRPPLSELRLGALSALPAQGLLPRAYA